MKLIQGLKDMIAHYESEAQQKRESLAWLELNQHLFDGLPEPTFFTSGFDFESLSHADVMRVVAAFPGKWTKSPESDAKVTYSTTFDGRMIRCYRGEPPANCKIIYEEVEIPAHKERRAKLVCKETAVAPINPDEEIPF